ncbi:MAG: tetratricopeptide repeat protein, partial [Kofleriaceae bacterium]
MQRLLILVSLLISGLAVADEKPLPPKPHPPRIAKAAGEAFVAAQEADARGDLKEAARQYDRAHQISPHPNTAYNLAEVYRRAKRIRDAIGMYETYLRLAPDATDRAEVTATIELLRKTPGTIEVVVDEPRGEVYVDGVPAGPAPAKLEVPAGTHRIDVITPITYGHSACAVAAGGTNTCRVPAKPREDGNVILSADWPMGGLNWPIGDQRFHMLGRFQVRPGRYDLKRLIENSCQPLFLEVPAKGFVYAYVSYRKTPGAK